MTQHFLNIGAGNAALAGFASVSQAPGADLQLDLSQGLPFADHSIAGIHCQNHLEYLSQEQGLLFLRECRRVLARGAILRVATPDLGAMLATFAAQSAPGAPEHQWINNPAEALNLQMRMEGRQWTYSAQDLQRAAMLAGLDSAVRRQPGESGMAPLAGQVAGAPGQLIMEFLPCKPVLDAQPLVSIVIPGYRARYFEAALSSALAQTYAHTEILVLDDSGDGDIRQLIEASAGAGRVRYLKNTPPLGEVKSLTRGIHEARGELIKPLYDDDVLLPHCVERMVQGMQACPDAALAISRRYTINAAGERFEEQLLAVANASCEISGLSLAAFTLATGRNFIGPPSSVMLRRADALTMAPSVMSFSGFETKGAGDVALYLHMLGRGECVFLADLLSEFRVHDNHTSSDPAIFAHERNSWMFLKHHGRRLGLMPADTNLKIKRGI
ncbi:glycosyltransferase [Pseudoduganella aquatica]|uniref:Glycosyltransferase n=1 Tax=Pseudoduganella aquatica TaxID=2660641 RepID=A0A7X4KP01_9BURK|nr:glycosyltransferase [Pseudoduganella aquatica]MYN09717.1 glycosyltransferase [Pseudoduganella aquatica]